MISEDVNSLAVFCEHVCSDNNDGLGAADDQTSLRFSNSSRLKFQDGAFIFLVFVKLILSLLTFVALQRLYTVRKMNSDQQQDDEELVLRVSTPSQTTSAPEVTAGEQPSAKSSLSVVEVVVEELVDISNVTVKLRLSETQVIAQVYPNRMRLHELKADLGRKFEVDAQLLRLKQGGREQSDDCQLKETRQDEYGIHEFDLELLPPILTDDESREDVGEGLRALDLNVYYNKYRLPDFITVHVAAEDALDGNTKDIVVEIENKSIVKPFLCGYKNKLTGVEYLDAFTQTGPYFDKWKLRRNISRDTQTYEHKQKLIDTMHDQMSQCFLDGNNVHHVSAAGDFLIVPRKYQTYMQKMRLENKLEKIKVIQRAWRRVLLKRFIQKCAREYRRLVANRIAEEAKFEEETEKRIKREQRMKQFPCNRDDFELLFSEVNKWKIAELKRIASMYDGPARVVEVNILLDKEIQMLNGIERQRTLVNKAMQDFRDDQLLKDLGKPLSWIGYKDQVIHLDLLRTQRVRFLTEIYQDLRKPLNKAERLELLTKIKPVLINECDYPEFPELFDLFDRERNLLLYTQFCDVDVLRKRQNILFLEMIKFSKDTPPQSVAKLMCTVCKQVKMYEQFAVCTRQNLVDTCKQCYNLKTAASDNTIYTAILRKLQRDERKKRCNASFAFVMQVDDIRHIIDQIWHRHSILSKKHDDLSCLRLPRWIKSEDWSPWNCVCLTEWEARDHYNIDVNLDRVYDHKMIQEIGNRHKLARRAFQRLTAVAVEFLETGEWWKVGMTKQRNVAMTNVLANQQRAKK